MISILEIRDLYFNYPESKKNILDKINLEVKKQEIIGIMGLSGSGKSTLCYCINGIIPNIYEGDIKGEILLHGKNIRDMKVSEISTRIGIVFQDPDSQLFSPTVEDEIAFGPENLCIKRQEIGTIIEDCLEIVEMTRYRYSHPKNLSGGEKQLIAIASALSLSPEILILDESMSQLDKSSRIRIKKIIKKLSSDGKTIIMVEHNKKNLDIADRILFLNNGRLASD